ncbi:hypothetical protein A9Q84_09120 [Halobacteriovorax marinus]|uniref:Solute-binding protein family 3/N-terminal domain-containing protein n=1 Tax=Halobacteriovorax marinus TaxID=97084 RepID=A0A1Y5FC04_9BACT|nr:hypothetical protein A9Q84_09120 [Halobacteriovorax marinus]
MKSLAFIILFIFSSVTSASVWKANRSWTPEDIQDFSSWILSEEYHPMIFFSINSPYFGIESDCADAIIAARVIYSFQNNLPFILKTSKHNNDVITNKSDRFDNIENELERVKAFIHHIGQSIGTEGLARFNSYPVKLNQLKPGDFYITRWKINGTFIRHASMIKEILPTGHLILYSSTTPVKARELDIREGMPLHIIEAKPWGFKRFIPHEIDMTTPVTLLQDYSLEQYQILEESGKDHFFPRVIDELKTREDTLDENLRRRVRNLCSALKMRKREVEFTALYLKELGNRCLNRDEFDEHSTPSRDQSLLNGIKRLLYGWKKIRRSTHITKVSQEIQLALDYLIRKQRSLEAKSALNELCHIDLQINDNRVRFNLKHFFDLKMSSRISSHPNDEIAQRWGASGPKTSCKTYY